MYPAILRAFFMVSQSDLLIKNRFDHYIYMELRSFKQFHVLTQPLLSSAVTEEQLQAVRSTFKNVNTQIPTDANIITPVNVDIQFGCHYNFPVLTFRNKDLQEQIYQQGSASDQPSLEVHNIRTVIENLTEHFAQLFVLLRPS